MMVTKLAKENYKQIKNESCFWKCNIDLLKTASRMWVLSQKASSESFCAVSDQKFTEGHCDSPTLLLFCQQIPCPLCFALRLVLWAHALSDVNLALCSQLLPDLLFLP